MAGVIHPLDPLSAEEIERAAKIIKRDHSDKPLLRFPLMMLSEPPKDQVRGFERGGVVSRRAAATVLDRADGRAYEAVVALDEDRIISWSPIDVGQPPILIEEFESTEQVVKQDPAWLAAMAKRGITDVEHVQVDLWSAGDFEIEGVDSTRRYARTTSYVRDVPADNGYARPIANVHAIVDLNAGEVIKVLDGDVVPVPPELGNYDAASVGNVRTDLKPLDIVQPDGPSFVVDGNLVQWQKWSVRVSLHATDGLVLHQVSYDDDGNERSILYRASLSEMVVPYGDPGDTFYWRNAFDAGEYGIGRNTGSLTLGCDCLGEIYYFDAVIGDDNGDPAVVENAICMHEEDYSILWKHWDLSSGASEVRRSRRLVISSIATLGNYEYGFYWYFYQDGHIEFEIKLTGIVQTRALQPGETDDYGVMVAPQLSAVHHQHLFSVRLDFEVDGPGNSVVEVDTVAVPPGPDNPHGNAITAEQTVLETEMGAQRVIDPFKDRYWKVINPSKLNRFGQPVGYKLKPAASSLLLAAHDSQIAARARFAEKHLWVTPYEPDEMHAAGDYPNQLGGEHGLPVWTAQDRNVTDTDVVVWHTIGVSHICRPEDWPIMPVATTGFSLLPVGFFDRNPSVDVAPSDSSTCH